MTFPSLRKLLYVAPLFGAIGIAAACGPYYEPSYQPPAPGSTPTGISLPCPQSVQYPQAFSSGQPACRPCVPPPVTEALPAQNAGAFYYQPITDGQGQTCYVLRQSPAVLNAQIPGTRLSVVNGKLHVQGVDGSKMSCEKFTILINGVEPAEVSVADRRISISSGKDIKGGDYLQGTAEQVSRIGSEGATLVLEGNAKLVYVRKGKKLEVATDLLSVNLSTGQVISEMDAPKAVTPIPPTDGPAPPAQTTGMPRNDGPPSGVSPPPATTIPMPRY